MSFVVWMNEGKLARDQVGGKGAALSDLSAAGFNVPLGFCVTADAYRYYANSTGLEPKIAEVLAQTEPAQPESVKSAARAICELIKATPLPADLREGLAGAYAELMAKQEMACAVRSSAISEDGNSASFAGLYETYLNVRGETDIIDRVHRCYESLWTERAVGYRARNGHDSDEAMSVVVMGLVPSESSGIAFTAHPVTGALDIVIINASWGLGEAIVSGRVTPDSFLVSKGSFTILEREIYPKEIATYPEGNGTVERPVERALQTQPSLSDEEACAVARLATQVEEHYGSPQDVEWALAQGELYLLQSRPITTL
jgi:pyruvate,water dikinase